MKRYEKSKQLLERAEISIPLGSQTFSKSKLTFKPGSSPLFITHGKGSHVWDVDGNEYIDMVNGLLPVVLGYCDPDVDYAIKSQLEKGIVFSLSTELESEVAEALIELIPCAEKVRFGKNGSDATAGAIRVSRAATGRDRVAVCGYHGWQDWYIGSTTRNKGVPKTVSELTSVFKYNNVDSLHALFTKHPGEFAAVIMEPMNVDEPKDSFLEKVKELAHKNGALFILDEIITGFRFHLGGAQALFNVTPDLATFGKSMGNGMPISAVVGKDQYMREMEEVFFSFTFGGEALSLAAAKAVINKMKSEPVIEKLWETGEAIRAGVKKLVNDSDLAHFVEIKGKPCWSILDFKESEGVNPNEVKSLFQQEMFKRGILVVGSNNVSYAHSNQDISKILQAYSEVFMIISKSISDDNLASLLDAPLVEPVFSVR